MIAPVLAALEAFGGCGRCEDRGGDGEDGEDLHVEGGCWEEVV